MGRACRQCLIEIGKTILRTTREGTRIDAVRAGRCFWATNGGTSAGVVRGEDSMKLSQRQAKGLQTWCRNAAIKHKDVKAGREIGPASTVSSLCKRGLIVKRPGVDGGYALTSLGVKELRLRGFRTQPPGIDV